MKRGIWAILALPLLTIPAIAAGEPVYHDCRPSEDVVNGRTVHKTVCQNENGDWVEVHPEKKKALQAPGPIVAAQKPKPKHIYRDCRPSQDIVQGREAWKTVCQNENGDWVEMPSR